MGKLQFHELILSELPDEATPQLYILYTKVKTGLGVTEACMYMYVKYVFFWFGYGLYDLLLHVWSVITLKTRGCPGSSSLRLGEGPSCSVAVSKGDDLHRLCVLI